MVRKFLGRHPYIKTQLINVYYFIYTNFLRNGLHYLAINLRVNRYKNISRFKDIHKGETCVIVATGPSVKVKDLELLKGIPTFSMNSIVKIYNKTDWRPTYYAIQDDNACRTLIDQFKEKDFENTEVFCANTIKKVPFKKYNKFFLDLLGHGTSEKNFKEYKFSNDASISVYDGFTIAYSILQLAVYMGFEKIYLLGLDATKFARHCAEYYSEKKVREIEKCNLGLEALIYRRQMNAFKCAKEYLEDKGIQVYNATRGGKMEIFERVDFDSVFRDKESTFMFDNK